ncbi:MAG: hydroxyphenylacetyl-CoA thioesterase PaaI [Anaerolineae bacterium]
MGADVVASEVHQRIARDPFASRLGIELEELRPGYSRVSMTLAPDMVNFHGITHGSVVFALVDAAFAAAGNSHGQVAVALDMSISFVAATRPGERLVAEAHEEYLGRRTALYHMTVRDESGQLVASSHGTVYRKRESLVKS